MNTETHMDNIKEKSKIVSPIEGIKNKLNIVYVIDIKSNLYPIDLIGSTQQQDLSVVEMVKTYTGKKTDVLYVMDSGTYTIAVSDTTFLNKHPILICNPNRNVNLVCTGNQKNKLLEVNDPTDLICFLSNTKYEKIVFFSLDSSFIHFIHNAIPFNTAYAFICQNSFADTGHFTRLSHKYHTISPHFNETSLARTLSKSGGEILPNFNGPFKILKYIYNGTPSINFYAPMSKLEETCGHPFKNRTTYLLTEQKKLQIVEKEKQYTRLLYEGKSIDRTDTPHPHRNEEVIRKRNKSIAQRLSKLFKQDTVIGQSQ